MTILAPSKGAYRGVRTLRGCDAEAANARRGNEETEVGEKQTTVAYVDAGVLEVQLRAVEGKAPLSISPAPSDPSQLSLSALPSKL